MFSYWLVLAVAVVTEILWALSLKLIQQQPGQWWPIAASVCLTAVNMTLLSFAMRGIPVGVAYAVWTGLGAVGVAAIGIIALGEPLGWTRLFFMAVIVVGVVGLKAASQA